MGFLPFNARLRWLERIPFVRTGARLLLFIPKLLLRVPSFDVLHIFSAGGLSFMLWTMPSVLVGRLYRKKVIINYRDGRAEQHLTRFRSARPVLQLAHAVVTPSNYLVNVFAKYGIRARSIFNVIDLDKFHYRHRGKLKPLFMTNRGLEPLYNVDCILRAFAIVQQRYPEATLTIAHDGVCRPALEQLARELELRNTRFIGSVPPANVPDLYDSADIYITSPNIDNMPGSLLECYASGVPVVATRAGGIPYIAVHEKTALLVELNDHEAIAASCLRLLEDEDLVRRLTEQGRKELAQYIPERCCEQWVALYGELMKRPARPSEPHDA